MTNRELQIQVNELEEQVTNLTAALEERPVTPPSSSELAAELMELKHANRELRRVTNRELRRAASGYRKSIRSLKARRVKPSRK